MLSAAFIHEPRLLFLDEPFVNLDPIYQHKLREYLIGLREEGRTVFLCSHILDIAQKLCQEMMILNHGRVVAAGSVAELTRKEDLESLFLRMTEYASKVYWVHRQLNASEQMVEKARKAKVEMVQAKPLRIVGEQTVTGLELEGGRRLDVNGVFIALGAKGSIELALELGIMPDPSGKIPVDENCRTEMEMVYACGDVTGTPWQLARAVGQGCVAGDNAAKSVRAEK